MSREHTKITRRAGRLPEDLLAGAQEPADVHDLVASPYGLLAVLRPHFAQEEGWFSLLEDEPAGRPR